MLCVLSSKGGQSVLRQTEPEASTRSAGVTRVRLNGAMAWRDEAASRLGSSGED